MERRVANGANGAKSGEWSEEWGMERRVANGAKSGEWSEEWRMERRVERKHNWKWNVIRKTVTANSMDLKRP